jgi:hypothetical protein
MTIPMTVTQEAHERAVQMLNRDLPPDYSVDVEVGMNGSENKAWLVISEDRILLKAHTNFVALVMGASREIKKRRPQLSVMSKQVGHS